MPDAPRLTWACDSGHHDECTWPECECACHDPEPPIVHLGIPPQLVAELGLIPPEPQRRNDD